MLQLPRDVFKVLSPSIPRSTAMFLQLLEHAPLEEILANPPREFYLSSGERELRRLVKVSYTALHVIRAVSALAQYLESDEVTTVRNIVSVLSALNTLETGTFIIGIRYRLLLENKRFSPGIRLKTVRSPYTTSSHRANLFIPYEDEHASAEPEKLDVLVDKLMELFVDRPIWELKDFTEVKVVVSGEDIDPFIITRDIFKQNVLDSLALNGSVGIGQSNFSFLGTDEFDASLLYCSPVKPK